LLVFLKFLCKGEFPPYLDWISKCSWRLLHGHRLHTLHFLSFFSILFNTWEFHLSLLLRIVYICVHLFLVD
jgi:hypothetical protein